MSILAQPKRGCLQIKKLLMFFITSCTMMLRKVTATRVVAAGEHPHSTLVHINQFEDQVGERQSKTDKTQAGSKSAMSLSTLLEVLLGSSLTSGLQYNLDNRNESL